MPIQSYAQHGLRVRRSCLTKFRISLMALAGMLSFVSAVGAEPPYVLLVRPRAERVGMYEKVELIIELDADFNNPFYPNEVDLQVEFTAPSGAMHHVWGFFNPTTADSLWMARFSPMEVGTWKFVVYVRDKNGTDRGNPGRFRVEPSSHHGFIKVAPNGRYLQYDDGTSFYGIGLWYNDGPVPQMQGVIKDQQLTELKRRGVNFICSRVPLLETLASGPGRYDQDHCRRLDRMIDMFEQHDMHFAFNIWFHNFLSETVSNMPWYRLNAYRLVCPATDFFDDAMSWEYQTKLYRYMIARWGYSRSIFLWFVVDEVNLTDGWERDPEGVHDWCRRAHDFFKQHDFHRRPTTGTHSGGRDKFWPEGCEIFELSARELYGAHRYPYLKDQGIVPGKDNPLRISYSAYAAEIQKLWRGYDKPALFPEAGATSFYHEPGTPGYLTDYHNALWVGLANGLCATPFWWEYWPEQPVDELGLIRDQRWQAFNRRMGSFNDSVRTSQLRHFHRFVADIDFAGQQWDQSEISVEGCDGWAMQGEKQTFGWIVHPQEPVAGRSLTIRGPTDGTYDARFYRTWIGEFLESQTAECRMGELAITVPLWKTKGGNPKYSDHDVAFLFTRTSPDDE